MYKAVENVPFCLEIWLALAKLEDYEKAKVVLNKARQSLPQEHSIWIHAAKLEETQNQNVKDVQQTLNSIIQKAIKILNKNKVKIKREEWIQQAISCEKSKNTMTSKAIIISTIGIGLQEQDYQRIWLEDIQQL